MSAATDRMRVPDAECEERDAIAERQRRRLEQLLAANLGPNAFYTKKLNFRLIEDTYQSEQDKRWVVVAPPGSEGTSLLLARASKPEQEAFVGNQAGGRVFLFLNSDDFWRDYTRMLSVGIRFVREPNTEPYGTVAVFEDLYGNLWDLLELKKEGHSVSRG